jgi:hypothetical protein
MREICLSGSEGGAGPKHPRPYPYQRKGRHPRTKNHARVLNILRMTARWARFDPWQALINESPSTPASD